MLDPPNCRPSRGADGRTTRKDTTIAYSIPTYTFTRSPEGRAVVTGPGSSYALMVLEKHAFTELESGGDRMELRLPASFDEERQSATVVDAANALHEFGFAVDLDARFGVPAPPTAAFVTTRSPDPGRELAELTGRLAEPGQDHEAVARHADAVFGDDGALARLASFTGALGGWAARLDHVPGDDLSDILAEHARALDHMHRQLLDTAVRIKALGTLHEDDRAPHPRRHAATATTRAIPTTDNPTRAEPAPPGGSRTHGGPTSPKTRTR
ncbi:hypothetical protein ACFRMQ_07685 [Kitasatospora sp. NPDC056783]|uniref:hypothetical protein n=1 Tax=Kitasatospora sp. NPDC056783 TaxID=3345943 RepID=UPI003673A359